MCPSKLPAGVGVGEEGEAEEEAEEEGKVEGEGAVVVILDDEVAHLKAGRLLLLFVFRL